MGPFPVPGSKEKMKLYFPDKPVPPDSPAYVERPADIKARHLVLQGTPVYLSGPPLTGKTSLLFRLGYLLLAQGLSFFYLKLTPELAPSDLEAFLEDCLRAKGNSLIAIDGLGENAEAYLDVLKRWLYRHPGSLLVVAGTFHPYPGEIAPLVEISLSFFYKPHILQLVNLLGLGQETAEELYRWSGGYPYIAHNLCAALAEGKKLEEAVENFKREDRKLLPLLKEALLTVPEASELYWRILQGEQILHRRITHLFREAPSLRGLFRSDEKGYVRLSSPILSSL